MQERKEGKNDKADFSRMKFRRAGRFLLYEEREARKAEGGDN